MEIHHKINQLLDVDDWPAYNVNILGDFGDSDIEPSPVVNEEIHKFCEKLIREENADTLTKNGKSNLTGTSKVEEKTNSEKNINYAHILKKNTVAASSTSNVPFEKKEYQEVKKLQRKTGHNEETKIQLMNAFRRLSDSEKLKSIYIQSIESKAVLIVLNKEVGEMKAELKTLKNNSIIRDLEKPNVFDTRRKLSPSYGIKLPIEDLESFDAFERTAEHEETEKFKACRSKMWLYIGRVSEGVEETDIINYIKKRCSSAAETDIAVSKLPTLGKAKAFKVGIGYKYHEELNQASFWPSNITIRRFNFWAHKNNSVVF
ncbi:unnamed protein product [Brassicogethes aeneus]|uniref:Uncharacterized protein n=1 Tax=Brassicogethes aeneus TaxID=1431903 RepID=A0A9P0B0G5_BRAAE|nr:unnamed protein product [Brassicogethes aeneus]